MVFALKNGLLHVYSTFLWGAKHETSAKLAKKYALNPFCIAQCVNLFLSLSQQQKKLRILLWQAVTTHVYKKARVLRYILLVFLWSLWLLLFYFFTSFRRVYKIISIQHLPVLQRCSRLSAGGGASSGPHTHCL